MTLAPSSVKVRPDLGDIGLAGSRTRRAGRSAGAMSIAIVQRLPQFAELLRIMASMR